MTLYDSIVFKNRPMMIGDSMFIYRFGGREFSHDMLPVRYVWLQNSAETLSVVGVEVF